MPSSAQNQWQNWLDEGVIRYSGWVPEGYQGAVAEKWDLLGQDNPFYKGIGAPGSRSGEWKVESEQDILDYLEFASEMAVHNKRRLGRLGVEDYTGQDIADFFVTPGERDRLERAKTETIKNITEAASRGASESGRYAASLYGDPRAVGVQEDTVKHYGKPGGALTTAQLELAKTIEAGRRKGPIEDLLMASQLGGTAHAAGQKTMAEAAMVPLTLGGAALGAAGAFSGALGAAAPPLAIGGGLTMLGAAPFVIGGLDQQNLANQRMAKMASSLNPAAVQNPMWSSKLKPIEGSKQRARPYGANRAALSDIYGAAGDDSSFMFS